MLNNHYLFLGKATNYQKNKKNINIKDLEQIRWAMLLPILFGQGLTRNQFVVSFLQPTMS